MRRQRGSRRTKLSPVPLRIRSRALRGLRESERRQEGVPRRRQGSPAGEALDDYADFLAAQAAQRADKPQDAYALLAGFGERYPDSIFVESAPVLLASLYLQQNNAQAALRVLEPLRDAAIAEHSNFKYA